jgi:hypothetical protein
VPALLRSFGAKTGRSDLGEARARELERALLELEALPKTAFRFAYLIWRKPWMAAGPDTYVDDLLGLAGGLNVIRGARYPETTLEELGQLGPERIFLPDEPFPFGEAHRDEVRRVVPLARIELVSGDDCCWHGVRSIRGVKLVGTLLRPKSEE